MSNKSFVFSSSSIIVFSDWIPITTGFLLKSIHVGNDVFPSKNLNISIPTLNKLIKEYELTSKPKINRPDIDAD